MSQINYIGFDYYSSSDIREISHGLKNSEPHAIEYAAKALANILPSNITLIPVPSACGFATHTLLLANEISRINPSILVLDCLEGFERQSLYERKKSNIPVNEHFFGFRVTENINASNAVLLDNVFATGTIMVYAQKAIGSPIPYAVFAKDYSISMVNHLSKMDKYRYLNRSLTSSTNVEKRTVICVVDEFCFLLDEDFKSVAHLVNLRLNKVIDGMTFGIFSKSELNKVLDNFRVSNSPFALVEQL